MQPNEDPRKRPLLTPQQLQLITRAPNRTKKGTPREEFEKLFRQSPRVSSDASEKPDVPGARICLGVVAGSCSLFVVQPEGIEDGKDR